MEFCLEWLACRAVSQLSCLYNNFELISGYYTMYIPETYLCSLVFEIGDICY